MIAALSGETLVSSLVWIVVAGLIFWLLTWLISYIGLPEPFAKVVKVIIAVLAVVFLCNAILTMAGHGFIRW